MGKSAVQERDFEIFWNEYPRKRAKLDAQRAWRALNLSENDTLAILLGIQAYRRSGEWKNAQYIPYPATFLRRRQWEDDLRKPDEKQPDAEACLFKKGYVPRMARRA